MKVHQEKLSLCQCSHLLETYYDIRFASEFIKDLSWWPCGKALGSGICCAPDAGRFSKSLQFDHLCRENHKKIEEIFCKISVLQVPQSNVPTKKQKVPPMTPVVCLPHGAQRCVGQMEAFTKIGADFLSCPQNSVQLASRRLDAKKYLSLFLRVLKPSNNMTKTLQSWHLSSWIPWAPSDNAPFVPCGTTWNVRDPWNLTVANLAAGGFYCQLLLKYIICIYAFARKAGKCSIPESLFHF